MVVMVVGQFGGVQSKGQPALDAAIERRQEELVGVVQLILLLSCFKQFLVILFTCC